jgi:exopolysaccharide/PEP-CTERM locus tyrosine autokinase
MTTHNQALRIDEAPDQQGMRDPLSVRRERLELNFKSLEKKGYLTPRLRDSQLADQYWPIKYELVRNASIPEGGRVGDGNLIGVTSALRSGAKTLTSFNLAMSLATGQDTTALLIDCDFRARSLTELVGLSKAPGLTDLLVGRAKSVEEVLLRTNVPNLGFLPAGQKHPGSVELLASKHMHDLVHEFSVRYRDRFLLFDGPPLLTCNDALALAYFAGQVLVVVEEGRDSQQDVEQATELLNKKTIVFTLLDKVS